MAAADDRLSVDVLGPLRVRDRDGGDRTPDGALQRRLLALFVLRRGRTVSVDTAVDTLWPADPPRDPVAALHNHVSRLRRSLGDGLVESTGDGYRLDPARIDLDADRLGDLVQQDQPTSPVEGGALDAALEDMLARWHGPAYPELDGTDDAAAEAARLGELRLRAIERRAERRLATGDTDGLVAELAALADAEPLRERPRALLLSALAATGRQVEALRVYDDFRRLLADELGIEPSPALAAQHTELLTGSGTVGDWSPPTRLPVPPGRLIGRAALLDDLVEAVDGSRVVTLVGPGGVGKTRLAVELGLRLLALRPGRPVVLCELGSATGDVAVDSVAAALGIDGRPGVPTDERIAAVLGAREAVLVLDNCEHVLDPAAALVDHLVPACPGITVVATSHERLRVHGERVVVVPPLSAEGDALDAVELFVDRAAAVGADFEPAAEDLAVIGDIVRRLDGLPLAIELAAARLHTHDLGEVAAGLDRRFALLSSGFRASSRHASLHAVVSWSVGLLDPSLQDTFADLSVFAGPFTGADAAAVGDVDEALAAAALGQLAERSLVLRTPDRRFGLLETLRAFGAEQLVASGRADEIGKRHAHHQIEWIEDANRRIFEPGGAVLAEIDAALPELRAAFAWLLGHGEVAEAGRLVVALFDYGFFRLRPDVLGWAEAVTAADPADRSPRAAGVWAVAAYAAWMAGDMVAMRRRTARSLAASEQAGALGREAASVRAAVALFDGELGASAEWFRRSAEVTSDVAQQLFARASMLLPLGYAGDPAGAEEAAALLGEIGERSGPHAAYAWYCAGEADLAVDVDRARGRYARALEVAAATHTSVVTGLAGASKASLDARLGDSHAAARDYRELLLHWRRAGMWSTQWTMLRSIAELLARLGRRREAAVLEGAVRATEAGHRIFGADAVALADLGARLRAELGDEAYESARHEGAMLDGDAAVEHALRSL